MDLKSFAAGVFFSCPIWALIAIAFGIKDAGTVAFLTLSFVAASLYLLYRKIKNKGNNNGNVG